jgi:hypothetical protein
MTRDVRLSNRARRRPWSLSRRTVIAALALAAASTSIPGTTGPVAAAAAPLAPVGSITRPLAGIFMNTGTREAFSTPAIADITGDGRPDLVAAGLDGVVEAYALPSRTRIWSVSLGRTAIQSSPATADLTGDGRADVVVGTMDGRVVILDGPSGRSVRTFHQGAPLHCAGGTDCRPDGFFATPAVADVNGDGRLDIVAPSWDHTVYAWSNDGGLLWRRFLEDTLWSSPAVADIDRNGSPEIILGGDIYAGNPLGVPAGGLVWVLNRNGTVYSGYPRSIPGQTVWSSPAVGDLNGDGWPEVVVGTGTNFGGSAGLNVFAFTASNRQNLSGWPVPVDGKAMGSPAIANLDGDAQLEVATATEGGHVYAFDTNGSRRWRCDACAGAHSSVTVADVDRDGQQEVIAAGDHQIRVLAGATGGVEGQANLTSGGWAPASAPAVAEVDGRTVIATTKSDTSLTIDLFTTNQPLCSADWPTFRQDTRRQGRASGASPLSWTPFACPADFVAQQYRDFLNRDLDGPGSSYWSALLRSGRPGAAIVESFMGSAEFGKVVAPVVRANFAIHGTYPRSAAAVRAGAASLRSGKSVASVIDGMVSDPGIKALTDAQFIDRLYRNLYGRGPSAAEATAERAKLQAGTSRGTLTAAHSEFAAGRLAPEVNVTMTYLGMLDRAPDASGFTYWASQARRGALVNLITGFQRSAEYRNRVT